MMKKFYTKLSFSFAGCLLYYIICQAASVSAFDNYYHSMSSITTTVPFSIESGTYDILIDTPFNITCAYNNAVTSIAAAEVEWKAGPIGHVEYIFKGRKLGSDREFNLTPENVTRNSPPDGRIMLMVDSVPPSYYSYSDNPKVRYECYLVTISGSVNFDINQTYINQSLELTVIDPVQILSITENPTVDEGQDLELECVTTGYPKAEITWTRTDGKVFPATLGGGLTHKSRNGTLMLRNITAESWATYQCSASNRVTYQPQIKTVNVIVQHKPVVYAHTLAMSQMEEYPTKLSCSSEQSFPPLKNVRWYHRPVQHSSMADGQVDISNDEEGGRYSYTNSSGDSSTVKSTLTIDAVKKIDYPRLFCCVYTNDMGSSETCISVKRSSKVVPVNGKKPMRGEINRSSLLSAQVLCILLSSMLSVIMYY